MAGRPLPADGAGLVEELLGQCCFPPSGTAVDCAFSGGADSTALVVLAAAAGCTVTAIHVDHGLHPGSSAAAADAASLADQLDVAFRVLRVNIADGPNLEARAREARWAALPAGALRGHTADDRAETVLINLLRGSGLAGLGAMGPSPFRPLLALRRSETAAVCAALGLRTVDDPTNEDRRFVRNRVRAELVPLMADIAGRDIVPILDRTAGLLAADLDLLDADGSDLDPADARALAAAPPALARRALRRWLTTGGLPPDLASVDRVLEVARGNVVACEITGGRRVERHGQRLRIVERRPVRSAADDGTLGAS